MHIIKLNIASTNHHLHFAFCYHLHIINLNNRDQRAKSDVQMHMRATFPTDRTVFKIEVSEDKLQYFPSRNEKMEPEKTKDADEDAVKNPETRFVNDTQEAARGSGAKKDAIAITRHETGIVPTIYSSLPVKVQETCKEKKNILLLKTHKTGSSTLQNIIYRYGDVRDLTFALPVTDVYMGCPDKFKPSFAIPSPTGEYNILANHARFHKESKIHT